MSSRSGKLSNAFFYTESVVLLALIVLTPYAMRFTPFERIYTDGAYDAPHTEDPLYTKRAVLIAFGLIGSAVCTICAIAALAFKPRRFSRLMLQVVMALCALAIGWRTYPYWVNGIYEVYTENASMAVRYQFDPKPLMPMAWFGGIYQLGTLLINVVIVGGLFFMLVLTLRIAKKGDWKAPWVWIILALSAVIALTFFMSPGYFAWFMD